MFKKLYFNISFAEALAHMPKYAKMVKDLLTNKEKLLELANTPMNENCSAVLLKKLPKKLGETVRFLIPCDFNGLESCMALADLGASINLMPLSMWKKLSLLELTSYPDCCLSSRYSRGCLRTVGIFHSCDCVVINYDVDPRVPLILGRPFLRTAHALVDVHGEELTLRVSDEKLVFNNVESTLKYPRKHGDESIHKIDILDILRGFHFMKFQKEIPYYKGIVDNEIQRIPLPLHVFEINETKKIKTSIDDAPDLELKDLPFHLDCSAPEKDLPFEIMCDASDFVVGAVLGKRKEKHFQPIYYASKTLSDAQTHYITTEKELLVVVYAFEKFWSYLVLSKTIMYMDHSALKYLFAKQDVKPRLENPHQGDLVGPTEGHMARTTPPRKFSTLVSTGPPYIAMPKTWSHIVMHVNVKEKSHKRMKCLRILSKMLRSLTFGASTLWACSRLHEGTDIYSWLSTMYLNRLKLRRSPLMDVEWLLDFEAVLFQIWNSTGYYQ
ncbi:reverse transcriptase domain-containing protein [Tanacetum coccineum]